MEEQQMTRRQRRILKRQERAGAKGLDKKRFRIHGGHVIGLLVLVGLAGAAIYGILRLKATTPAATYTAGPIHWHAKFEVDLCGKTQDFSMYGSGSHHAGLPLLHTHGDGIIHIEGRIIQKEDISLGRFFDAIEVPFNKDRIMDKRNGDECSPGRPGSIKMFVNGAPNDQFRDYITQGTPNAADQVIRIVFE